MKIIKKIFVVAFTVYLFTMAQAKACSMREIQQVSGTTQASGQRVSLVWSGNKAEPHRLQVIANVPEGGVFWSLDTQILDTTFSFVIPTLHAVVKAQVSQGCDDLSVNDVQSAEPVFYINSSPTCALPRDDWEYGNRIFRFKPNARISGYSFSLFEIKKTEEQKSATKLIKKLEIKKPFSFTEDNRVAFDFNEQFSLNALTSGATYVMSVLPKCASFQGSPLAIKLD
jgi:hypothetical protein